MGKRTASGHVVSQLTHSMRALAHSCAINHAPYANTVATVEKLIKRTASNLFTRLSTSPLIIFPLMQK